MFYFLLYISFFYSLIFSNTFSTLLGDCKLEIYGGRVEDISEIVQLIKNEVENITTEFGALERRPFSIYITDNMQDFNEKSKGPIPEWGIAVAKMNPDRAILKAPGIGNISYSRMKEVIIHELNHIYMFRIENYDTIPSWFKEGMAMRSSNEFSLLHKIEISKFIWHKQTIPLQRLKNISPYSRGKVLLAYGESAAAIQAMEFYYGHNILINILDNMKNGADFEGAFNKASDDEFIDFQIKFEDYLEANFNWIFLLRATKYIYVILPLILIIGFIFHHYRSKKILAKWELEEKLEDSEWNRELPS